MSKYEDIIWLGEISRKKAVRRICDCGTCSGHAKAVAPDAVGYLSWSDEKGNGVTQWIDTEEEYQTLKEKFGEA